MYLINNNTQEIMIIKSIVIINMEPKQYSVEFLKFKDMAQYNRFQNNILDAYEMYKIDIYVNSQAIQNGLDRIGNSNKTVLYNLFSAIYSIYAENNPGWSFVEQQ